MSFTILPSILALVIKFWLFWFSRNLFTREKSELVLFLLGLTVLNLSELTLLLLFGANANAGANDIEYALRAYYVGAVMSLVGFGLLAGKYAQLRWRWWKLSQAIAAISLVSLVTLSDVIISGWTALSYSFTRVPGSQYWLFQLYALITLFASMALLVWTSVRNQSYVHKWRSRVVFLAMMPTVLSAITIIILMQFGVAINATIVLPSMITVLLVTVVWSETTTGLFGVLSVIPGTGERQLRRSIKYEVMKIGAEVLDGDQVSLKERLKNIEYQLVGNVYRLCDKDKALTAEVLKMSDSSLRRKLPLEMKNAARPTADKTSD